VILNDSYELLVAGGNLREELASAEAVAEKIVQEPREKESELPCQGRIDMFHHRNVVHRKLSVLWELLKLTSDVRISIAHVHRKLR